MLPIDASKAAKALYGRCRHGMKKFDEGFAELGR